ncbi:hypothetical protein A4R89_14820 (plasmid) [Acetobacter ascendens]|nr:hypothetical protein A4R89_14820 [Acetobacter ascendens]
MNVMRCLMKADHIYHIRELDRLYAMLHRVGIYWTSLTANPLEKLPTKIGKTKITGALDFAHGIIGPFSRDSG